MNRFYTVIIIGLFTFVGGVVSARVWESPFVSKASIVFIDRCGEVAAAAKAECWKKEAEDIVKRQGTERALDFMAYVYDHDPSFAAPCHDIAHKVGQITYLLFASGRKVGVNEKTAYCSFGFYHGFMETLLVKKAGLAKAQEFCRMVDTELGKRSRQACYHGVGHGVIDTHNPVFWGNERAIIAPAESLCRQFAESPEQLELCGTGIFDALAIAYYNNQNGYAMKRDDPLWPCREQVEPFQTACYRDLMDAILWLGDYDLARASPYVERFVDRTHAPASIKALADASIRFVINKKDPTVYLSVCRARREDLVEPCVQGLASGMMQFGKPNYEYKLALAFCGSSLLTSRERELCLRTVSDSAKARYNSKQLALICKQIASSDQAICSP